MKTDQEQSSESTKEERQLILQEYTKEDFEVANALQEKEFRCRDHPVRLPDDLEQSITKIMELWNKEKLGGAIKNIDDLMVPVRIFLHLGVLMAECKIWNTNQKDSSQLLLM
jgi:hypothetical protein